MKAPDLLELVAAMLLFLPPRRSSSPLSTFRMHSDLAIVPKLENPICLRKEAGLAGLELRLGGLTWFDPPEFVPGAVTHQRKTLRHQHQHPPPVSTMKHHDQA